MAGEREFHALKPSTAKDDCANDVRQNCMSRFRVEMTRRTDWGRSRMDQFGRKRKACI